MSWDHIASGKSRWIPTEDGKGDWTYTCPKCQDTGWLMEIKADPFYTELATSHRCECATKTAPIQQRPDISSSWAWVKHDNRLRHRVIGDMTYWIYHDGTLKVYNWPEDRFDCYEPDLALASMYEDIYNRRSTRRSHPGADDYYAR